MCIYELIKMKINDETMVQYEADIFPTSLVIKYVFKAAVWSLLSNIRNALHNVNKSIFIKNNKLLVMSSKKVLSRLPHLQKK